MSETWTILKVLDWTAGRFERAGFDSARLDAQVLLAHVLGCDRVALYTSFDKPLSKDELATYRGLIERRLGGEPVAYLVGHQEFWSLDFEVDPRVLIPRADTETLVQVALELGDLLDEGQGIEGVDLATGSGAVAIAIAHERPGWRMSATDLSPEALELARRNADKHGMGERIELLQGDLAEALDERRFHLIVSNPPYVSSAEMEALAPELRREPRAALWGGDDGLDLIRRLVAAAPGHLHPAGWVAIEHGYDQAAAVAELARSAGFGRVELRQDLAGRARVTYLRR